jgi:hypothetical protein
MQGSSSLLTSPLLLWRRGLGRGGPSPFSTLWFPATIQRVAAPIVRLKGHDGLLSLPLSSKGGEGNGGAANEQFMSLMQPKQLM